MTQAASTQSWQAAPSKAIKQPVNEALLQLPVVILWKRFRAQAPSCCFLVPRLPFGLSPDLGCIPFVFRQLLHNPPPQRWVRLPPPGPCLLQGGLTHPCRESREIATWAVVPGR